MIDKSIKTKNPKIHQWINLIGITGGAQILVQGLGFLSGILIIRLLSTTEYALYTLANTMLGAILILADSGISNAVMATGGKVWQNRVELGKVIVTGMKLRKKLALLSLIVMVPLMVYLFKQHGANWITIILIILAFIPSFYASLTDSLLEIAPKLHQQILPLQQNQLEVGGFRLLLTVIFIFFFPLAYVVILAGSIPRIYGNYQLKKITLKAADLNQNSDYDAQNEILQQVKRSMPMCIYAVISGQIGLWIISFFGKTATIAQIGALSRLSVLFLVFTTITNTLIVPRFARLKEERGKIIFVFFVTILVTILLCLLILVSTYFFSNQILFIIGKNYNTLNTELVLNIMVSCIALLASVISNLIISRGWVINSYLLIISNIISIIIGVVYFKMYTLIGALYYNILAVSVHFLLVFIYGLLKIYQIKEK